MKYRSFFFFLEKIIKEFINLSSAEIAPDSDGA